MLKKQISMCLAVVFFAVASSSAYAERYSVYYHANGHYRTKGSTDNYEQALRLYVAVEPGKTRFLVDNDNQVAIREMGFRDRLDDMYRKYGVGRDICGGDTAFHEVYWHWDGNFHSSIHDTYEAALAAFQALEVGRSKIIVRSRDLNYRDRWGFDDTIASLKNTANARE